MKTLLRTLKHFCFWGLLDTLVLTLAFSVPFRIIFSEAVYGYESVPVKILCMVLLYSLVLLPIFEALDFLLTRNLPLRDFLLMDMPARLWIPYKGLDIRNVARFEELKLDKNDVLTYVLRFAEMLIWWTLRILAVAAIALSKESAIHLLIACLPLSGLITRLLIVFLAWLLLLFLSQALFRRLTGRWRSAAAAKKGAGKPPARARKRNLSINIELGRPSKPLPRSAIPNRCKACGGPFPECRRSCRAYDE